MEKAHPTARRNRAPRQCAAVRPHEHAIDSELTRWLTFFPEGERLDPAALPDWM